MAEIQLTKGLVALVDDEEYLWLSKYNWCSDSTGYACRRKRKSEGGVGLVYMHREIVGAEEGMDTDHINGDIRDNRRNNLRIVTRSENLLNSQRQRPASGFRGVQRHGNKYYVYVTYSGEITYCGKFDSPIEAALEYDKIARELKGGFATLNFPDEGERSAHRF